MIVHPQIQTVADHGAVVALMGQRRLSEKLETELGEYRLDGDPSVGQLSFVSTADPSRRVDTRMRMVASIAPGPRSLLWGWAHPQAVDRSAAEQLRALGQQHGLDALTTAEVPFTTDATGDELGAELARLGHAVAAAAVEATGATPYYLAPIGGGSLVVALLDGVELRPLSLALDGAGLTSALVEVPTTNPRASLMGFARHGGFGVRTEGDVDTIADGGSSVEVTWDELGRLSGIRANLRS